MRDNGVMGCKWDLEPLTLGTIFAIHGIAEVSIFGSFLSCFGIPMMILNTKMGALGLKHRDIIPIPVDAFVCGMILLALFQFF